MKKTQTYLGDTLGLQVSFLPPPEASHWPLYLTEAYEFRLCVINSAKLMGLRVRDIFPAASTLAKHAAWIHQRTGLGVLFIFDQLALSQRRRLIAARLSFVCPDAQLFLPDLGIDLREQIRDIRIKPTTLAPAAQVLVLACLHRIIADGSPFTGVEMGARFGYTKMTMSRALDELRQLEWIVTEGSRSSSRHRFVLGGRELWDQARPRLRSPVTKRIYLDEWFSGERFQSGESALSELTLLGYPRRSTWAITPAQWKMLQQKPGTHLLPDTAKDNAHAEFELWRYDPALLSQPPVVDALSLALSFKEATDERVQMAVDELLRKFPW